MLMPSAPYKQWNALFLAVAFPVIALILLSGGNFDFALTSYAALLWWCCLPAWCFHGGAGAGGVASSATAWA